MTSLKDFSKRVFMTNKLMTFVAITLIVFAIGMGGLFAAGWFDKQAKEEAALLGPSTTTSQPSGGQGTGASPAPTEQTYSLSEVATHNTSDDCWIIIDEQVYSVAGYLSAHPGGANAIVPYCGKDASGAFKAIERGRGHSSVAQQIKAQYRIGKLAR